LFLEPASVLALGQQPLLVQVNKLTQPNVAQHRQIWAWMPFELRLGN
jgi:hypothetical protein